MTRKRFVKLLMAEGTPRNRAQSIARLYNRGKIPYERAYKNYVLTRGVIKAFEGVRAEARRQDEIICRFARSLDALKKGLVISNEPKRIY